MSVNESVNTSVEWELKYLITEEDYLSTVGLGKCVTQVNYYFFSSQSDFTCRIREKKECYEFTYKEKTKRAGERIEYNSCISKDRFNSFIKKGIDVTDFYALTGIEAIFPLHYVGFLKTERMVYFADSLKIEVDKNYYLDKIDYEVECEVSSDAEYKKAEKYLLNRFHTSQSKTKTERFRNALNAIQQ